MFVNISTGNVGIGTLNASNISISGSSVGIGGGGGILANVGWTPTIAPYPTLTLPAGGAFTPSRSNGQHLWIGNEVQYTFNVAGTVASAPTNTALDYTISVPYPVAVAASYPADTIVGDLWLTVIYSGNSNLFKAYARTLASDANSLVVRAITGTTDESLGTLLAGSVITLQGTATYASTSVNQNTGGALAAGLQTVWIPSTAVNWAPTTTSPVFTLPAGAALTYSRSNARYMYVGTDVTYNVDIGGTLTASPTSAASDYLLSVPYAVATATYTNPTIVGELWLSVVNGTNSNTFKSYARTLTGGNASNVALRMLTGTADEAFGALTSGSTFTLQGTLKYTTTATNSNIGVPTSYIAANFRQDAAGNVGLNTGASNIRAKFDVIQSSNIPALVVDQYGTGDAFQVKDGGVTQLVVDGTGNVGIGTATSQNVLDVYSKVLCVNGSNVIRGSGSGAGLSICSDPSGNIYSAGYYDSTGTQILKNLDGTSSAYTLPIDAGLTDAYLIKYNSLGIVQGFTTIRGTGDDSGNGLCSDASGNIYMTGLYDSTTTQILTNLDGTSSAYTLPIDGGLSDAFLIKYNSLGIVQGFTTIRGTADDSGNGVCSDSSGNIYMTGSYDSTTTQILKNLDGTSSAYTLPIDAGSADAFLIKYNSLGIVQGFTTIRGTVNDYGYGVCSDLSGNIYMTGSYDTTTTQVLTNLDGTSSAYTLPIDAGSADAFLIKYNSLGIVQGFTTIRGTVNDYGYGVCSDASGNIYMTGSYDSSGTQILKNLDGTSSSYTLPTDSFTDAFLIKYNSQGVVQGFSTLRGSSSDIGYAVCSDMFGNIYMAGRCYVSANTQILKNLDGSSSPYIIPTSQGSGNVGTIIKYNSLGVVQGFIILQGSGVNSVYGVCSDPYGNIYATGKYYSRTAITINNFDETPSNYNLQITSTDLLSTRTDAFIIKYADQFKNIMNIHKNNGTNINAKLNIVGNLNVNSSATINNNLIVGLTGNVGIGTAIAAAKLHTYGSVIREMNSTVTRYYGAYTGVAEATNLVITIILTFTNTPFLAKVSILSYRLVSATTNGQNVSSLTCQLTGGSAAGDAATVAIAKSTPVITTVGSGAFSATIASTPTTATFTTTAFTADAGCEVWVETVWGNLSSIDVNGTVTTFAY
jgi:hypothetical protein